jgi:uncharacterized protein
MSDVKFKTAANCIHVSYYSGPIQVNTTMFVCKDRGVVQSTSLKSMSAQTVDINYTLALEVSVNRASYGQLTEGGPIPIPPPRNEFHLFENRQAWAVVNPNLNAMVQGDLRCDGDPVCLDTIKTMNTQLDQPANVEFHGKFQMTSGQTRNLVSTYQLHPGVEFVKAPSPSSGLEPSLEECWKVKNESMRLILKGNLSYILGNCTIPVSDDATCLITDHVALPLGWNRDN